MKKKLFIGLLGMAMVLAAAGCEKKTEDKTQTAEVKKEAVKEEEAAIMIAAAASMEETFTKELIPMFEEQYLNIKVEGTYDASGKLQTQIESGLKADVFLSAAKKQMTDLADKKLIDQSTVVDLLQNKIVLIVPKDSGAAITKFEDIVNANSIAIGDPASVPAGQYAQESLTNLGLYSGIEAKLSLGTNVTEVLNWVAEGSAEAGIVYATDAAISENVKVVAEAPADSLKQKIIYPIGILEGSQNKEVAKSFVTFLQSAEAMSILEKAGFTANK